MDTAKAIIDEMVHDAERRVARDRFIQELATAVALRVPHTCTSGLAQEDFAAIKELAVAYRSRGKNISLRIFLGLVGFVCLGGIVTFLSKYGWGPLANLFTAS